MGTPRKRHKVDRVLLFGPKQKVSTERLRWAFGTFQPYKSPVPDGIQPILLQRALSQLEATIRKILISSLALGHIRTAWSIVTLVFIPKAGKKDPSA